MSDSQVQANVYRYLKQNDYTQSDANTWATNISKDIAIANAYQQKSAYATEETSSSIDNIINKIQFVHAVKRNLPGASSMFGEVGATLAQSIVGGIGAFINPTPQEDEKDCNDPYKDIPGVDFLHDMSVYWRKDVADADDTDALIHLQNAVGGNNEYSSEAIMTVYRNALEVEKMGLPDEAKAYQETYDKHREKYGGFTAFFQALGENPTFALGTTVGSMGRVLRTATTKTGYERGVKGGVALGTTAAIASPYAAPVSIPLATISGVFGTVSGTMEQASTFQQLMQEQLSADGKEFTPENIRAFLEDDEVIEYKDPNMGILNLKGTRAEIIKRRSIRRGIAIGTVDTFAGLLGAGVTGKMATGAFTAKQIAATGSAFAVGGGLASETTGTIAGGQELEIGEMLLAGIAEKAVALKGITTVQA